MKPTSDSNTTSNANTTRNANTSGNVNATSNANTNGNANTTRQPVPKARQSSVYSTLNDRKVSSNMGAAERVWAPDYSGKYVRRSSYQDDKQPINKFGGDYDPYKHRRIQNPVSNIGCLLLVVKGSIGMGVLGMPEAFKHTGLVLGIVATFMIGALVSYGVNLLVKTEYNLCKRKRVGYMSYGQAMQYAMEEGPDWMIGFSKYMRVTINVFMAWSQFSFCAYYAMAAAKNLKVVIDEFHCNMLPVRLLMCVVFFGLLAVAYVPNLKLFVYCAVIGLLLMYTSFVWISCYIYQQTPSPGSRLLTGTPADWMYFMRTTLFAMESIAVHTSVEASSERPQDFIGFFGVMNLAMFVIATTYSFLGFSGYCIYGKHIKSSLLDYLPPNTTIFRSIYILHAVALLTNFRLNSFTVFNIIWEEFFTGKMSQKKQNMYHYALLTGFCVLIVLVTMSPEDYFNGMANVVSIIEVTVLVVGFPALMDLCYLWPDNYGRYNWKFYKDIALFLFALLVLAVGVYVIVKGYLEPAGSTVTCETGGNSTGI